MDQLLHQAIFDKNYPDLTIRALGDPLRQKITATSPTAEPRIYKASSLGKPPLPAVPDRPFIIHNELPSTVHQEVSETSNAANRFFQLYVHDEPGDFMLINEIIGLLEPLIKALPSQVSPSGSRCLGVQWQGVSGDISDESYGTNLRIATFRLTGRWA